MAPSKSPADVQRAGLNLGALRSAIVAQPWSLHLPVVTELMHVLRDDAAVSSQYSPAVDADSKMQIVAGTAVIPLTGILQPKSNVITRYYGGTATMQVEQDCQRALADSQVKAIVLLVDSPGGSALGNEEVSRTIMAARGRKPITAFVRGMAASAAYYLASAADKIVASPSSTIGSIGTVLVHAEESKYDDRVGLKFTPIFHGQHKADGNPYEPLSEQSRQSLQRYVDGYGAQFVEAVARHRGIAAKDVTARFGQGQVFLADEALRLGMIDSVGTLELATERASRPVITSRIREALLIGQLVSYAPTDQQCEAALESCLSHCGLRMSEGRKLLMGGERDVLKLLRCSVDPRSEYGRAVRTFIGYVP
ncbi:MAG: signal peptide peptidase SppA [Pirellulaceae bacterium]